MKKEYQTYVIVIINEERIVTLNRQYLPNFDLKKVEGHWSVEYINCLLSSSVKIDKEKILKLRIELSKHSTSSKNDNIENNNFEHFFIYDENLKPAEIEKNRVKTSEILKRCTGFELQYFE